MQYYLSRIYQKPDISNPVAHLVLLATSYNEADAVAWEYAAALNMGNVEIISTMMKQMDTINK